MSIAAAGVLSITLWGWLWPNDVVRDEQDGTLKDLDARELQVELEDESFEGGVEEALAAYRAYLHLQTGDLSMRAEATRRLADLNLRAGDDAQLEAGPTSLSNKHNEEAIRILEPLVIQQGHAADHRNLLVRVHCTLGRCEYRDGNWQAALDSFERADRLQEAGLKWHRFFVAMVSARRTPC